MLKVLAFLALALPIMANALETDNYMAWRGELKDVSAAANKYMLEELEGVIERANAESQTLSCKTITMRYANRFKTSPRNGHPLEHWAKTELHEGEILPLEAKFLDQTIYAEPARFYLKYFEVAPTININGYYLGLDKLSHFASTGRRYLKQYLKLKKQGLTEAELHEAVVRFGLKNEASWLGYWPSGVFSYGDMEANYQGFLFFKGLCLEGDMLKQDESGKWSITEAPDLKKHISGNWDETYNLSFRLNSSWSKVAVALKANYCALEKSELVQRRFDYYRTTTTDSFSVEFIRGLQEAGSLSAPVPQDAPVLSQFCE